MRERVNGATGLAAGDRPDRWDRPANRDILVDWFWALFAFGLALAMFASGGLGTAEEEQRGLDALGVLIAAGISLPLLARRYAPVPVFLVVMGSLVALGALKYPPDVTVGPAVALFTLARAAGRDVPSQLAIGLAIAAFLTVAVALTLSYDSFFAAEIGFTGILWVAIWLAGRSSRLKAEHISSLEERAERAEREAEGERRLAAAEERTRIARDLHDSAGHAINVILVEAGAARLLRERDPERAEKALETIEEVAREQIGEIDRLVHALRADDRDDQSIGDCDGPTDGPRGPAVADELFERMRASGLDLNVEWNDRRLLGPRVGRAGFRILQEALTNAVKHGTGSASVRVDYGDEEVAFTVENPTEGNEPGPERFGLSGMRERVGLLGGRLEVGAENGCFRIRAVLPYDRDYVPPPAAEQPTGVESDER